MKFNADSKSCEFEVGDQFLRGIELLVIKYPKNGGGFLATGQGGAGRGIPAQSVPYDQSKIDSDGYPHICIPMIGYPTLEWKFVGNTRDRDVVRLARMV